MDTPEPDLESLKKHLDMEEQVLRIEKMRRELERDDRRTAVFEKATSFVRNAAEAVKTAGQKTQQSSPQLDRPESPATDGPREETALLIIIAILVAVLILIAVGFVVIAKFAERSGTDNQSAAPTHQQTNSSPSAPPMTLSSPPVVAYAPSEPPTVLYALPPQPVQVAPNSTQNKYPKPINDAVAKACDAEYSRFLQNTDNLDLGTFAKLNQQAQAKRARCVHQG